ncbi:Polynucleotidyl transferase, ribonuclease H-like superfamily protein [Arabidopsis thaliana]|uniref:Ribonuclease n=1 Tax=Arabidopsis thaliana TaxID=3702 RepID=A8MRI6_ARATH|nr:Polynucleotidyl transferase, ribonuclease H-like superfamily protein [Arabidopsis thaliana]AEC07658.1 Polynucleotidyl transferase, ribonuclease H-like superfamily protein [Arabidopsis thaliana]|eukprot:NP_001077956.1 Polynucleotidyl transferase, ribonuclease H-like superfamily protein [Arabidopsis thaliana]
MESECLTPEWASQPCLMGIDEAGRGPVLGPMVYGCMYCPISYQSSLASLHFADSKTLKEEKREELYESLKLDKSLGWAVDVIDPRELSAKMLAKVLDMGVLLTEAYLDTVGDPDKYRIKLSERFPSIKFVVSKKADSLFPIVSGASIVAKVTRDRALKEWLVEETGEDINRNFGSGYPGDPETKAWLVQHKHSVFGFPSLVRFSWGTCTTHLKGEVEVAWEADENEESGNGSSSKRQAKLSSFGFKTCEKRSEEIESSGKGRCKFLQARKIQQLTQF